MRIDFESVEALIQRRIDELVERDGPFSEYALSHLRGLMRELRELAAAERCELTGRLTIRPDILDKPRAKTMDELVTPKQLVAVRAIAHTQRVNAEAECLEVLGCKPEELSRRAASAYIDHLKSENLVTREALAKAS